MDDSQEKAEPSDEKELDSADPSDEIAEIDSDSLAADDENPPDIDFILNLPLDLTVEYGRTRKKISKLLDLQKGTVIELSKLKGEPVDILANDKLIAKGEVVVEDDKYAIRITEIISRLERIKKL